MVDRHAEDTSNPARAAEHARALPLRLAGLRRRRALGPPGSADVEPDPAQRVTASRDGRTEGTPPHKGERGSRNDAPRRPHRDGRYRNAPISPSSSPFRPLLTLTPAN